MHHFLKTVGRLCRCWLLALPLAVLGSGGNLQTATDLRAEVALASRSGGPLILLFSRQDCPYCQTIKRDYLQPLASNLRYRDKVVVRQINQDSDAPITDFRGERSTHARFAAAERIKLVPVVAFYGPDGKRLTDPIIGTRLPDFYQSYLEQAIEKSVLALKTR